MRESDRDGHKRKKMWGEAGLYNSYDLSNGRNFVALILMKHKCLDLAKFS